MIQTLAFNARLPVLLGASPFYRTPNAPIARGMQWTKEDFVRSRLTAMAVETRDCKRDDLYTLFVTTRIINFLKGLPIGSDAELADLPSRSWSHSRTQAGIALLARLSETNKLYLWTKQGLVENPRFKAELFERVLLRAGQIECQDGAKLAVGNLAGCSR
jgi:hypothetical protein